MDGGKPKDLVHKIADFLSDYCWESCSALGAILFALSSILLSNAKSISGWVLFSIASVLSILSCVKLAIKNGSICKLKSQKEESSTKVQLLEATLEKYMEENYQLFQYVLVSISNALNFNGTDRISIYKKNRDQLIIISRYSINPDYNKINRKSYPISDGYIGEAMKNGDFFIDNLPECAGGKKEQYYQSVACRCNIDKNVLRNLSMKSRTYYCKALTDSYGAERKAVVVFESTKEKRFTKEDIDKILNREESKLLPFIEKMHLKIPGTDFASSKGF